MGTPQARAPRNQKLKCQYEIGYHSHVVHTPPCASDTRANLKACPHFRAVQSSFGPPFLFFEHRAQRVFTGTVCQIFSLTFAVDVYRKLPAAASTVRIIPECLPRDPFDDSPPPPFPADVTPDANGSRCVVAPFPVTPPERVLIVLHHFQNGIAEMNCSSERYTFAAVFTVGKATNRCLLQSLHYNYPSVTARAHVIDSMNVMEIIRARHTV